MREGGTQTAQTPTDIQDACGSLPHSFPSGSALQISCGGQVPTRNQALSSHRHRDDKASSPERNFTSSLQCRETCVLKNFAAVFFFMELLLVNFCTCRIGLRRAAAHTVQCSLEVNSATLCYNTLIRLEITQTCQGAGAVTDFNLCRTHLTTEKRSEKD